MNGARIALWFAIAIAVVAAGCGDDDDPGPTDPQIIAITVTPSEIVLPTEGAVMQLTVTAQTTAAPRDVTADPGTSFDSVNPSIANAVAGGELIANGIGQTTIVVSNSGFTDTAMVTVDTLAAIAISDVVVTPESVTMTSLGQTRATTTTVIWENGAELRSLSGPPIAYATTNDTVAGVDAAGVITAVADGSAIVTASYAGKSDSIAVTIAVPPPISFSQILPRFTAGGSSCTTSMCHPGTGPAERNLRMNSYANIMRGDSQSGPVVMPGNGAGSLLVRVLRGNVAVPTTPQMPQNKPKFSSAFIDTVQLWIDQGALNN